MPTPPSHDAGKDLRPSRYSAAVRLSAMEREQVFAAVADERRSIAALIDDLDRDQLATASLCAGWDVKTVAAHLVSDFADGFWGFMASGLRHGSIDRGIDALARRRAQAPAMEIADMLRRHADYRLSPPVTGPLSGLTDVLVHGADMRIPLGLPHRPNPDHVARVLDFPRAQPNLGSSRADDCVVSRCTTTTPVEHGATAIRFGGRAWQ
jgi:uncharacterized protein (TIGR03083 family)